MKTASQFFVLAGFALATGACSQTATEPTVPATISEADAARIADATIAQWVTMDAARIKATYAPGVVAFDFANPPLESDRATFDKAQDAFAAAKYDKIAPVERKFQILTPDVFIMTGTLKATSTAIPANNTLVRCTDVFQKDAGGKWPVVNEHCSAVPKT